MVGQTVEKLRQIGSDLASSWYFRVWGLLWLLFALVVFSGLIILSQSSNQAQHEMDIQLWVQNVSSIQFPRFHFRLDHRGNEIFNTSGITCYFGTTQLQILECQSWRGMQPAQNQCIAFNSDSYSALNDWNFGDSRIQCSLSTTGEGYQGNSMIAYELEGQNVYGLGAMAFASTEIAPTANAWVILEKNLLTQNGNTVELWGRDLLYHSNAPVTNLYNVTSIMGSFLVRNFQPRDTYNGWMTVGDIGGVAFFCVILHTIVMAIIGLFMKNSSTFLAESE